MAFIWWMYLADVVGSLYVCLTLAAICCVVGYGAWAVWASMEDEARPPFRVLAFAIGFSAVASIIPSTKTVYAIAAVSAGSEALSTATGQKAVKALNVWLGRQIADEPQPKGR